MEPDANIPETIQALTAKSSRLRVEFLNTDLDLGFTYCETARVEAELDPPAMERLMEKVRTVIQTVEQFSPRVEDEAERAKIIIRKERLKSELVAIEGLRRSR